MEQFFIDYLDRLSVLHNQIENAIDGLLPEALDWSPGPEMNSIAVLVSHAMGAERFWVGDVAAGPPSGRVRAMEFEVQGLALSDLQLLLANTLAFVTETQPTFSLAELAELKDLPNREGQFTVGWCLAHALEHTAVHTGHIEIMRQLWDQR